MPPLRTQNTVCTEKYRHVHNWKSKFPSQHALWASMLGANWHSLTLLPQLQVLTEEEVVNILHSLIKSNRHTLAEWVFKYILLVENQNTVISFSELCEKDWLFPCSLLTVKRKMLTYLWKSLHTVWKQRQFFIRKVKKSIILVPASEKQRDSTVSLIFSFIKENKVMILLQVHRPPQGLHPPSPGGLLLLPGRSVTLALPAPDPSFTSGSVCTKLSFIYSKTQPIVISEHHSKPRNKRS